MIGFGMLGVGGISPVIMTGLEDAPSARLVATGSRSLEKATAFAEQFGGKSYGSYEEVLDDPDVDAVYLPLPTAMLYTWAMKAIEKGKHILADKPLPHGSKLKEILDECEKKGLLFMDGTHFVHSTRYHVVVKRIEEGIIGKVRKINAAFSWPDVNASNIRLNPDLEPYTALGDLGWYCVKAAQMVFGYDHPHQKAQMFVNQRDSQHQGILSLRGVVEFNEDQSLAFDCAYKDSGLRQWVEIVGDLGAFRIDDFVLPWNGSTVFVDKSDLDPLLKYERIISVSKDPKTGEKLPLTPPKSEKLLIENRDGLSQLSLMIENFVTAIPSPELRAFYAKSALGTQTVLDQLFDSINKNK